jgi:hypothetical protein
VLHPSFSAGWVIVPGETDLRFAGTCFAFDRPNVLLTAAHCVRAFDAGDVTVTIERDRVEHGLEVLRIDLHPSSDIAALTIRARELFDPFTGVSPIVSSGDSVIAFGYPEDTTPGGILPVPRFFRGHIQRLFMHESPFGHQYTAAELSFPAPGGLSGGPVALANDAGRVIGVVTENRLTTTFLQTVSDVDVDGRRYREHVHSTIEYGIAALVNLEEEWLREVTGDA